MPTPPTDEISTMEAAELLGYSGRSMVVKLVHEGKLVPSRQLPGTTGAYLFWRADVQRLAKDLLAKTRARLERMEQSA